MRGILLVFSALILSSSVLHSQTFDKSRLEGNWYNLRKNGFLRLRIHSDTLQSERVNPDMSFKSRLRGRFHIDKVITQNHLTYILSKVSDTSSKIKVTTLISFVAGQQMLVAVNGINRPFTDIAKAEALLKKDTLEKFGNTYYSESEIQRFKTLKPLNAMKKPDFIAFISDYYEERHRSLKTIEEKFGSAAVDIADDEMLKKTLIKTGFSPFFKDEEYEKLFKKFSDDKEVKPILDKYQEQ